MKNQATPNPIPLDTDYLLTFLVDLLNTPSPTGFAQQAIDRVAQAMRELGLDPQQTRKGSLVAELPGLSADAPRGLTAHVDTLGAMVEETKENGRLRLSKLGGYAWNAAEGEGCTIFTQDGQQIRGSILIDLASTHVHGAKMSAQERDDEHMEVRLDLRSSSFAETKTAGIEVGDFVAFDPRVEVGPAGFIRSRHLDDKACVACMLAAVKAIQSAGVTPTQRTTLHISNYEEVGHGAAGFPADLAELLTLDMAAMGMGQTSDEFHVTICVKDSAGPYHHGLSQHLRQLAEDHAIPTVIDIYPFYSSDGQALWRSGADARVALIGPGVDASHSYERTHMDALVATTRLIIAYLLN